MGWARLESEKRQGAQVDFPSPDLEINACLKIVPQQATPWYELSFENHSKIPSQESVGSGRKV